jgi:general stress protein 26
MARERELEEKFWKALKNDRTLMIGLVESDDDPQPMTAQLDGDKESGPIYIFTSSDTDLARHLEQAGEATAQFASKGHDLFAALRGRLSLYNDRETIDRLWNPFVAAWFEGKSDPKLRLLRYDVERAHIWLNENSLFAGVKLLLGADPKKDYADKTADVRMS